MLENVHVPVPGGSADLVPVCISLNLPFPDPEAKNGAGSAKPVTAKITYL